MIAVQHIGKESNDWERQAFLGLDADAAPGYGIASFDLDRLCERLDAVIDAVGIAKVAQGLKIPAATLRAFRSRKAMRGRDALAVNIETRLDAVEHIVGRLTTEQQSNLDTLRLAIACNGLRATARQLRVDPANLRRKLNRAVKS